MNNRKLTFNLISHKFEVCHYLTRNGLFNSAKRLIKIQFFMWHFVLNRILVNSISLKGTKLYKNQWITKPTNVLRKFTSLYSSQDMPKSPNSYTIHGNTKNSLQTECEKHKSSHFLVIFTSLPGHITPLYKRFSKQPLIKYLGKL